MSKCDRPSRGPTILIIGDDDLTARPLHTGLAGAGYDVRRAGSGVEALVALRSTQADLILMNLLLPDTDGLILCSTLKVRFRAPIIVLGAGAGEVDRALAVESGAIDLLPTPVDIEALLTQLPAIVPTPGSTLSSAAGGQRSGVSADDPAPH